jgi:hypothetical protein
MTFSNVAVVLGKEKEVNIEMTMPGPLNIVTLDLPAGESNIQYENRVRITGGHAPYNYILANGALPPGLKLDVTNGIISGRPTRSGGYSFAIGVTDSLNTYAERGYTIAVTSKPLKIATVGLSAGVIGQAYQKTLLASGGAGAYHWAVVGNLPEGIKFDQTSGVFSGVPVTAGSGDLIVTVSDEDGGTISKSFTFNIIAPLQISTKIVADGNVNQLYSEAIQVGGGTNPFMFSIVGQLPPGLLINNKTGIISGTPSVVGVWNFTVVVNDSLLPKHQLATQSLSIHINP